MRDLTSDDELRSAHDRAENTVKALDLHDELFVGDFCVGLERNESGVHILTGIISFPFNLQILNSYAPVFTIAKDVIEGVLFV